MTTIEVGTQKIKLKTEGDKLWIFIYGTSSIKQSFKNFMKDMKVNINPKRGIFKYHSNTIHLAMKIYDDNRINPLLMGHSIIYIGGHSMGGAVAKCLHKLLSFVRDRTLRTYIYGGYPVDNNIDDERVTRFIKGKDIIPYWMSWKYKNNGKVVRLPSDGKGKWPFRFITDHLTYNFKNFWED